MLTTFNAAIELAGTRRIAQKAGEDRKAYLSRARKACNVIKAKLEGTGWYRYCHESFLIRDTLLVAEKWFYDLGTFGVEHIAAGSNLRSPAIDYLNAGDSYELTLMYVRGKFRVGCCGDIVDRGNYK